MTEQQATHERLSREDDVKGPSHRSFGLTFAVVFVLIGSWPLLRGRPPRWWAVGMAALFLVAAILAPEVLRPLNQGWLWLGMLLHRLMSPIVMALLFFTTVTPIAVLLRAFGKDPLRVRRDSSVSTYWIDRRPPGPAPSTMTRQF